MAGWRYIASKLPGDGTEIFLDYDLPLQGVEVVTTLSGADQMDALITPEIARLKVNGAPIFVPWSTAIYAELDGAIRGGALVVDVVENGPDLKLETVGFTGYPNGMPYDGDKVFKKEDPAEIFRHIWAHLQAMKDGNLGVTVDTTKTNVRLGASQDLSDIALGGATGDNDSLVYGWWQTMDLGQEIANLAAQTPFDYKMNLAWNGNAISKFIQIGFPRLGRRRTDLRFMVGENVMIEPEIKFDGDDYASDIWAFGAGEGRQMVRDLTQRNDIGRLRRVAVLQNKSLRTKAEVRGLALQEKTKRTGAQDITSIQVRNSTHAKIGSYTVGDEILVQSHTGWSAGLNMWCRILSIRLNTENDVSTLDLLRSDKAV